eukprot:12938015-Prorocentrum_lima.AAC.1
MSLDISNAYGCLSREVACRHLLELDDLAARAAAQWVCYSQIGVLQIELGADIIPTTDGIPQGDPMSTAACCCALHH